MKIKENLQRYSKSLTLLQQFITKEIILSHTYLCVLYKGYYYIKCSTFKWIRYQTHTYLSMNY